MLLLELTMLKEDTFLHPPDPSTYNADAAWNAKSFPLG